MAKGLRRSRERGADRRTEDRDHEPLEEETDDVQAVRVERNGEAGGRGEIRRDERGPDDRDEGGPESGEDCARRDRNGEKEIGAGAAERRDRELHPGDREGEEHGEAVPHRPGPVRPQQTERQIEEPVLRRLHARGASRAMPSVTLPERASGKFRAGGLEV